MTTKNTTGLLSLKPFEPSREQTHLRERLFSLAFGAVQWPWLLKSLYGGSKASKDALLRRLELPLDALPHLGSWKADTFFLHRLVDIIEQNRPANVVELGCGASSLVAARALQLHGGGQLTGYDQHAPFAEATSLWLGEHGVSASLRHAPLTVRSPEWPGSWYSLFDIPEQIDLLVIDGPPWTVHPYVRGMAECLFDRIPVGGIVLLDDAARPGERVVARRWRALWPDFAFRLDKRGAKGTLIGIRMPAPV
ncbi:class I SAM-dependent methyltransferase [Altericroceibacterium xinjiangense]|uniref:class I SAM-dependent methyltransferase n=1 Tax=Altericroceibacterium xinjiangense TaxID=762261 RepID=UPI000F7DD55E|nr:class I SAM-dependent methyltransferase [Altericroceibacterium xinjiangense]